MRGAELGEVCALVLHPLLGYELDGGIALGSFAFAARDETRKRDEVAALEVIVEVGGRVDVAAVQDLHAKVSVARERATCLAQRGLLPGNQLSDMMLHMKRMTAREMHQNLSEVLSRVEAGEEVEITRRGRPVARLMPAAPNSRNGEVYDFVGRLRRQYPGTPLTSPVASDHVIAEREESI